MRGHRNLLGAILLATLSIWATATPPSHAAPGPASAPRAASWFSVPEVDDEVLLRPPGFFKSVGGLSIETE
jgi:hypothetical protein